MTSRLVITLCVVLGLSSMGTAQQAACKAVEVPVGVVSMTGGVFRGLAAEDFIGRVQKKPVAVKSLTYDDGPRRVLIVADASKKLSSDTRKAETEMLQVLLAGGRPQDQFALMVARGPGQDVKFTTDHAAITQGLNEPGDGKRGKEPGVLDTVMTGIEWFGEPQSGDAIVVMAADLEGNHKANAKQVAKALETNHIRMFGLALGPVQTKSSVATSLITSTTSQGMAEAKPLVGEGSYDTGDEHFFPLTTNSGGMVFGAMNGSSRRSYKLTDPKLLQEIRQRAAVVSRMISSYYRMQIEPPPMSHPEEWDLTINEVVQKSAHPAIILYPRELGPC